MKKSLPIIVVLLLVMALCALPVAAETPAQTETISSGAALSSDATAAAFIEGETYETESGRFNVVYQDGGFVITKYNKDENYVIVPIELVDVDNGAKYYIWGIDSYAFSGKKLGSVILPASIDTLAEDAFYNCPNLRKIILPYGDWSDLWLPFTNIAADASIYQAETDVRYPDVYGWFCQYVYCMTDDGILNGSNGNFNPTNDLTRSQLCKILAVASGDDLSGYDKASAFKDVPANWARPYINWAYANGVVTMPANAKFRPNDPVSRQELCTMLGRYAADVDNYTLPNKRAAVPFKDDAKIGSFAKNFVYDMYEATVVGGYTDGTFRPQGNASRAEAAKMITIYLYPDFDD